MRRQVAWTIEPSRHVILLTAIHNVNYHERKQRKRAEHKKNCTDCQSDDDLN